MQSQFQYTVGGIAHHLDGVERRAIGSPLADHLMCPHPHGLVSLAQLFTYAPRVVARTHQKGKAHLCARPRERHQHCHHDPAQARTAHRPLSAGERTRTVMPAEARSCCPSAAESVSSMTRSTQAPAGTKVATMSRSNGRLTARGDQRARLST